MFNGFSTKTSVDALGLIKYSAHSGGKLKIQQRKI